MVKGDKSKTMKTGRPSKDKKSSRVSKLGKEKKSKKSIKDEKDMEGELEKAEVQKSIVGVEQVPPGDHTLKMERPELVDQEEKETVKSGKSRKSIKGKVGKPNKTGINKETLSKIPTLKTGQIKKPGQKVSSKSLIPDEPVLSEVEETKLNTIPEETVDIGADEIYITEDLLEEEEELEDEFEEDIKRFDDLYMKIDTDDLGEEEYGQEVEESTIDSDDSDEFEMDITMDIESTVDILKSNFLDIVSRIPKVDEISIDESIERFINRLEGNVIEETDEEVEAEEEDIPVAELLSTTSTSSEVESSEEISMEFEFEPSSDKEVGIADEKNISEENLFEVLIQLEKKPATTEFIDFEMLERLAEKKQLMQDTENFLDNLVGCVVNEAEYIDPKVILRNSLDKVKLVQKLLKSVDEMSYERKVKAFLERKCVEYYRRQKKSLWPIIPETPDMLNEELEKFNVAINRLNDAMGREVAMGKLIISKIEDVEIQKDEQEEELETLVTQLHTMIRKAFGSRNNDRFNAFVNQQINEMSSLRKEVSESRNKLIHLQHIMANLTKKKAEIENLGPNLRLRDYESLSTETYNLSKKIEERNENMTIFRKRFKTYTNVLAHLKEKEAVLRLLLENKQTVLTSFQSEEQDLRSYIHDMRRNRLEVKKRIQELSFQSGLIDKPALCIDYDETLENCLTHREIVKKLKIEGYKLEKRIDFYTKRERISDFRYSLNNPLGEIGA